MSDETQAQDPTKDNPDQAGDQENPNAADPDEVLANAEDGDASGDGDIQPPGDVDSDGDPVADPDIEVDEDKPVHIEAHDVKQALHEYTRVFVIAGEVSGKVGRAVERMPAGWDDTAYQEATERDAIANGWRADGPVKQAYAKKFDDKNIEVAYTLPVIPAADAPVQESPAVPFEERERVVRIGDDEEPSA